MGATPPPIGEEGEEEEEEEEEGQRECGRWRGAGGG